MGQKKLQRFAAIKAFENVLEYPQDMKGRWNSHFNNNNPIVVELACGKGEYSIGLASMYPNINCIGVDIKGNRLWAGATKAKQANLQNVAFLRTDIEKITDYFEQGEIDAIWITFPDPQLRFSKAKKRLTHPRFLRLYQQILKTGGVVHLKTDSPHLYRFTKTVINLYELLLLEDTDNLYAKPLSAAELGIKTHYERLDIAQSNRIHYLQFKIDTHLSIEKDQTLKQITSEQEIDGRD
jgi:tRNA (guanine-N7-)-methyltransferase